MTALEQLGAYVASVAVAPDLRARLKLHAIDTVGAWIATASTREARALMALRDQLRPSTGPGDPTLDLVTGCACVRMSEIDDIHIASMITPGSIVIPGALTVAASLPHVDADALCAAMVAGYEAMVRFGAAIDGPNVLYRGIWPSYFAAPLGVAAVASRLLSLDAGKTAHALALAVTMAPPGVGHHNATSSSRWLAIGANARNGYLAARAAQAGFTSDVGVLDGAFLANTLNIKPDVSRVTEKLGDGAALESTSFKPWCAARQTMAATQAMHELIAQGISADRISAVEVAIPPQFQRMVDHGTGDGDRLTRLTSLQHQVALAALAPGEAYHTGQTRPISDAVRALAGKILVRVDDGLGKNYPASWPAHIRVEAGGAWHERTVSHVPGDPQRPFDAAQVREKFRKFAGRKIGDAAMDGVIAAVGATLDGNTTPAQLLGTIEQARAAVMAA